MPLHPRLIASQCTVESTSGRRNAPLTIEVTNKLLTRTGHVACGSIMWEHRAVACMSVITFRSYQRLWHRSTGTARAGMLEHARPRGDSGSYCLLLPAVVAPDCHSSLIANLFESAPCICTGRSTAAANDVIRDLTSELFLVVS